MTRRRRLAFVGLALPIIALLIALGVWQVQRLAWKRTLIAQVEARLAAPPVRTPGPERWPAIGTNDAYTRVKASGHWGGGDTFVQAVTDLGPGFWVMTPFLDERGFVVLVNRGFVPAERRSATPRPPSGNARVSGLLRLTEPRGGFLRTNDPAAGRWYSRDVAVIAKSRGLDGAAPYFIDADAQTSPHSPRGGLTVVRFPNNHLQYALTWFAMALLLAGVTARLALVRENAVV